MLATASITVTPTEMRFKDLLTYFMSGLQQFFGVRFYHKLGASAPQYSLNAFS
tara:strand:- start:100 stop:258 length:159 start_codon:yes stop_codon:yes gene_type:complete